MDRLKLKDSRGRPLTQGLFLEIGYNTEFAVYTLKDDDFEYDGQVYPSLKKLYLECMDPEEYIFATTYLLGWDQWQRICNNKILKKHVDEWRTELEYKLRSLGVQSIIEHAQGPKGYQAAKWLAEKGFNRRGAGRPSKEDVESEKRFQAKIEEEYGADIVRLEWTG